MENRELILLRTLLKSTSSFNILKYETDKKKRGKIIGGFIGIAVLYLMLTAFTILTGIGYGLIGLTDSIPMLCAFLIIVMEFIFTMFKTNGYLFAFKEYDMLMAMPFKTKSVVSCKFLYMYIKNLPFTLCISLSMMIVYGIFTKPGILTYLIWIVLSLILPLIPMVLASGIGALIAKMGSKSRHKSLVQTILTFIFVIFCFSLRYIIEALIRNDQVTNLLTGLSNTLNSVKNIFFLAGWFEDAVVSHSISRILLLLVCSVLIYEIFFTIVGKYYREINSGLMTGVARKNYKMSSQKTRSIRRSVAFKEFKHFMNSTAYVTNMGIGELLLVILSILALFVDMDQVIQTITGNSPLTKESILPAIPWIIYFFTGMSSTTSASFSLEGKNYWIVQSLPVSKKDLVLGKMLFNMYLTVPFTLLGTICVGFACKSSVPQILAFALLGIVLDAFSSAFGMRCDVKHYRHDWENEIEVIKQGSSVGWYMLINMLGTFILLVVSAIIGRFIGIILITLVFTLIMGVLTYLAYRSCLKNLKKVF